MNHNQSQEPHHEQLWKRAVQVPMRWTDAYDSLPTFVFLLHLISLLLSPDSEMDYIIANELSPEALSSINKVIQEFKLGHNTNFNQLKRDWGLGTDTDTKTDSTAPFPLPGIILQESDAFECLRSLLHFVSESAAYRDLTSSSKRINLVPLVTMEYYVFLFDRVLLKVAKAAKEERAMPNNPEKATLNNFDAIADSSLWEPPSVREARAKCKAEGTTWKKPQLQMYRTKAALAMRLVFVNAVEARKKGYAT